MNLYRISTFLLLLLFSVLFAERSFAHIRVTPAGRMGTSDQIKFIQNNPANPTVADNPGPCANFTTRSATPLQLTPGQSMTITVQETINHPGRFYVQFSPANDQGFWNAANRLALVQDNQNNGTTNITFNLPNATCDACTLRVLQEMDEQPGEFYVHCLDIRIASANPSPTPTPTPAPSANVTAASTSAAENRPGFGGCGMSGGSKKAGHRAENGAHLALAALPLLVLLGLRRRR